MEKRGWWERSLVLLAPEALHEVCRSEATVFCGSASVLNGSISKQGGLETLMELLTRTVESALSRMWRETAKKPSSILARLRYFVSMVAGKRDVAVK